MASNVNKSKSAERTSEYKERPARKNLSLFDFLKNKFPFSKPIAGKEKRKSTTEFLLSEIEANYIESPRTPSARQVSLVATPILQKS